jgi:peptidoglycan/LPS O-acetylase OafA/YrhL
LEANADVRRSASLRAAAAPEPMKQGTSLYLDLVRFFAALAVFLEHIREHTLPNFGRFWQEHPFWNSHLGSYSQVAVIVFFVLSGYVIAHVLATRESTPLEYTASRVARLYSVVLPALFLVTVCNYLVAFASLGAIRIGLHYLGTALFMGHFWLWPDLEPPAADPMWSLSFEAVYYVAIALLVFASGSWRIVSLVLLSLLAGPTAVLLAPTWLLGYWVYHVQQGRQLPAGAARLLWLGCTFLLALCPLVRENIRYPLPFLRMPDKHLGELLAAYLAAGCFAASLLAFDALSDKAQPFLQPLTRVIRWLGSMTFALYLFHQPLLTLFSVYRVVRPSVAPVLWVVWVVGGTLLTVATVGRLCERSKGAYKRLFLSVRIARNRGAVGRK